LLYDNLKDILKPESIPQVVLILAKYQFQAAFVADNEINTVAMLTEIMIDGDFQ
jgi:replication factor C small subunit